jgi:hypothetical protein
VGGRRRYASIHSWPPPLLPFVDWIGLRVGFAGCEVCTVLDRVGTLARYCTVPWRIISGAVGAEVSA